MEEPKRRAHGAQQAQSMHETPPQRRRRPPQAQNAQAAPELSGQKENRSRKGRKYRHILTRAGIGAAALLGMAGAALIRAVKRIKKEHLRWAAMALCACVAILSAWQVGSIVLRGVRTRQLGQELSQQREAAMQSGETKTPAQLTGFMPETTEAPKEPVRQESVQQLEAEKMEEPQAPKSMATPEPDVVKTTKYHQVGGDPLPEMAALHERNRDLVAWIQIPDVLDLPVVYRDNDYYLTRDFNRQKNASGTIFLDENHPFREKTQNLLLHGHNMKDGTMFGRLAQYLYDDSYIRNHPFISFDTLWKKEQYVIVAVLNVSLKLGDARFFNYFTHDTFSSDAEFASYIRQLQLRSEYAIPIDVHSGDALLTLSTCLDDDRLVIVARRLREDESRSELRELIRMTTRQ